MTKLTRFGCIGLLIVSMAAACWASETSGSGLPSPPPPPAAECTTDCTATETAPAAPDASVSTADVMNVLVTWLVQSIL